MPQRLRAWIATSGDLASLAGAFVVTYGPQTLDGLLGRSALVSRRTVHRVAERMERNLDGPGVEGAWGVSARLQRRRVMEGRLARARELHRRGWKAQLSVLGEEHLRRALLAGNGAILWRYDFSSSHILKRALYEAGYRLIHLSAPYHGNRFRTVAGQLVVAPLYRRAEVKYLGERIEIGRHGDLGYLRELVDHLGRNSVVSIMGEGGTGMKRPARVFGDERVFATGAPSLARLTGAALLPAYAHRVRVDAYEVVIRPPINPDSTAGRVAYVDQAIASFAGELERAIRLHPESWNRWLTQ